MQTSKSQQIYNFIKANKSATAREVAVGVKHPVAYTAKLLWLLEQRGAVVGVKVFGAYTQYMAVKGAQFNKARGTSATAQHKAKRKAQVMEVKQAITAMQTLLRKLETA